MPERTVERMFAEFEAEALTIFRPPGVAAARRRARVLRRRRRGFLAAVAALLLGGPAGAFALANRDDAPTPSPMPTTSPSPSDEPVVRRIAPSGAPGTLQELRFVNARTGWALFSTCALGGGPASECRSAVVRTDDAGLTWRTNAVPDRIRGHLQLIPGPDGGTLAVMAQTGWLVTSDGGRTFTEHPRDSPPLPAQRALATLSGYLLRCADATALTVVDPGPACTRQVLATVGQRRLPDQPPVQLRTTQPHQLAEGGDRRLWLAVHQEGRTIVLVRGSAATDRWRKLPSVPGELSLLVSPDGRHVWLAGFQQRKPLWQLTGDSWRELPGLPDDTGSVAALDDGLLIVGGVYGTVGFIVEGRYVDRPELRNRVGSTGPGVGVLADGTIELDYGGPKALGAGSGTERTWVRFAS
ncbi:hypothetical protein [Micromonospora sp. KC721]|uniref:hypothetical protein n=1 Tax=Micromonospora sp. KC721 TaxID=2530380 RepID=UPI00104C1BB2|nr:hypothetical protein [Micromonospora sp. KC721]TDB79326.1 hypothetical protein E1182_13070 [Micromonospora sp. KC721]